MWESLWRYLYYRAFRGTTSNLRGLLFPHPASLGSGRSWFIGGNFAKWVWVPVDVAGRGVWRRAQVGLVAQSSATGVTVAVTPPCSAIRFRNPKVPRYPPPARRDTPPPWPPACCEWDRKVQWGGGPEKGVTWIWGAVARFWRNISDSAGTWWLYARHCVARLGSPHGCATKQVGDGGGCRWEMRERGLGWRVEWGQAKEPASQCVRVCEYDPSSNYPPRSNRALVKAHLVGRTALSGQFDFPACFARNRVCTVSQLISASGSELPKRTRNTPPWEKHGSNQNMRMIWFLVLWLCWRSLDQREIKIYIYIYVCVCAICAIISEAHKPTMFMG